MINVSIYFGHYRWVEKSGIGQARVNQTTALALQDEAVNVSTRYTRDADIVHINTTFLSSVLLARLAMRRGQAVIYHAHSTEEDFRNSFCGSNLLAPLFGLWLRICYRNCHLVLTPTPYSRRLLESRYHLGRPVRDISNGIDLSAFYPDPERRRRFRERHGYRADEQVVLSVGHYMERKGFPDFIRLARRYPERSFIWYGYTAAGVLSEEVRRELRNLPPNLKLPGFVPSAELQEAYAGCDIFVFMTHEETEGIVLLEALASDIPVLLRDIEIYREWMTDGVDCYKATSLDEFAERMDQILEGSLPSTVVAGRHVARQRSLQEIGRQLLGIYRNLLAEREKAQARPRRRTESG
ncbi:MAG: glycosyltransferase [Bacillota bacterium]|nr:glycosyltransferase [Bacillota bacterium]